MHIDFAKLAFKLPDVIRAAVAIKNQIKGSGKEKHDAVISEIPNMIDLAEYAIDKDLLKDDVVAGLISSYVSAEAAVLKAKNALRDGILAKSNK